MKCPLPIVHKNGTVVSPGKQISMKKSFKQTETVQNEIKNSALFDSPNTEPKETSRVQARRQYNTPGKNN